MNVEQIKIDDLNPNPKNPRKITKTELNKLIRSIKEFNFVDPVIVNKNKDRFNIIIGGHQRVVAAKRLGYKTVPVTYVDLDEDREHLLNISLNELSGEWDDDKLFRILSELNEKQIDLTLTGFDEPFIDEILQAHKEKDQESLIDIAPAVPVKPKSQKGEIYKLGNDHRLMCGDSTLKEDVGALMGEKKADMIWTDPPYGVSYRGTNNPNDRDWGIMSNDDLRGDELFTFLQKAFTNVAQHTKDNPALYTCYASTNHIIFERALNEAGWIIKQQLIWEKGHMLGHSDYHWSHEPLFYCRKKDKNSEWIGDRTQKTYIMNSTVEQLEDLTKEKLVEIIAQIRSQSDIIHQQKDANVTYLHATQKPVELSRIMIKNSSRPRELLLEPFGGSGSTVIACESTNRICYCMEIESRFVDVILNRWQTFTGKDPIRLTDGKPWSEIKK